MSDSIEAPDGMEELEYRAHQLAELDREKKQLQKQLRAVKDKRDTAEKDLLLFAKGAGLKALLDSGNLEVVIEGSNYSTTYRLKTRVKHALVPTAEAPERYKKSPEKVNITEMSRFLSALPRYDCLMPIYARLKSQLKKGKMPEEVTEIVKLSPYDTISVKVV